MRHVAYKTWAQGRLARKNSPSTAPSAAFPRKNSPSAAPPTAFPRKSSPNTAPPLALPRKSSPSKRKNADFRAFRACRANFFALTHTSGHAGRTFSRTRRDNVATLKPTTPLRVPEQQPLKPPSPLRPKTAPKNTDFAPAKVMAVSIPHRYQRAKAMAVSDKRAAWPTGPGCGTRGRRRTLAGRPVGGRRYKRRQTNAIPITSREPLLQTSSI